VCCALCVVTSGLAVLCCLLYIGALFESKFGSVPGLTWMHSRLKTGVFCIFFTSWFVLAVDRPLAYVAGPLLALHGVGQIVLSQKYVDERPSTGKQTAGGRRTGRAGTGGSGYAANGGGYSANGYSANNNSNSNNMYNANNNAYAGNSGPVEDYSQYEAGPPMSISGPTNVLRGEEVYGMEQQQMQQQQQQQQQMQQQQMQIDQQQMQMQMQMDQQMSYDARPQSRTKPQLGAHRSRGQYDNTADFA
jgi:hypothetical protein